MRTHLSLILFVLLAALSAPTAKAVCNPVPFNFSEVVDIWASDQTSSAPPATIYHSVTFSGTTQMAPSCVPSARHYAKVHNVLNGVGGWTVGAQVCTNCFTTATSTVSVNFGEWQDGTDTVGSEAWCTFAGAFVRNGDRGNVYKGKYIKVHATGVLVTVGTWAVENWCQDPGNPPDFAPVVSVLDTRAAAPAPGYYDGWTECYRLQLSPPGTPWKCSGHPNAVIVDYSNIKHLCTNFDNGVNNGDDAFDWVEYWFQKAQGWTLHILAH